MKHNLTIDVTHQETYDVTKNIVEITHNPLCIENDTQLNSSIHPYISNYAHRRVQKELENERFATLIKLARVLDDENISKVINSLGYNLDVK